jgi:hypothetical protein
MAPLYVSADEIALPQHMPVVVSNQQNVPLRMTIYTGTASFSVNAGDARAARDLRCPMVALVDVNGQPGRAIVQVDRARLRGAIATASLASLRTKDDDTINAVDSAEANLHRVTLFPSGIEVDAIVLTFQIVAQRSDVNRIGYQVTVLSEQLEDPQSSVHLLDGTNWDGSYAFIGPVITPNGNGVPVR